MINVAQTLPKRYEEDIFHILLNHFLWNLANNCKRRIGAVIIKWRINIKVFFKMKLPPNKKVENKCQRADRIGDYYMATHPALLSCNLIG